ILPSEGIEDGVGSNNLDDYPDNKPQKLKRIVQDTSIVTERKKPRMDVKDSKPEDSSDSANAIGKKEVVEHSAKKRKTGVMILESCMTRPTQHRGPKIIKLGATAAG
nr:hypothetical protein [Tanacetum cinerariifolium]